MLIQTLTPRADVDDGSTITDFLPAERARGVTIQSAAITFHWPPFDATTDACSSLDVSSRHMINLIDTPGHADFTFEVIRSLRILDGAVCILDGVAGVEAQTEKVWAQSARYHIPRIIYINKLDRDGAAFGKTIKEIASRLHTWPAVCQIPMFRGKGEDFCGVGDVIRLQAYQWAGDGDGKKIKTFSLDELRASNHAFYEELKKARAALVELLAGHDEQMVAKYLECNEDHLAIPALDLIASLRRCVFDPTSNVIPVFAGASFRNIGVQPLLDAVVHLLPSPEEAPDPEVSLGNINGTLSGLLSGKSIALQPQIKRATKQSMALGRRSGTALVQNLESCALAFKVVNDSRRGLLVYVRVYSGKISRGTTLFNTNLQISERAPRLLRMYASDSTEIQSLPAGQIGVIPGLKHARTGDTLISYIGANPQTGPPAPLNTLQLRPIDVPPAVFFSSVESHNLGEEKSVKDALAILIREDPSLQLSVDEDSGQTHLSGMGDFHLEIARDRLINDLKAKANMGKIEIAYRESILRPSPSETYLFEREAAGRSGKAGCVATVKPLLDEPAASAEIMDEFSYSSMDDGNRITITVRGAENTNIGLEPWSGNLPGHLSAPVIHNALKNGVLGALGRGINHGFPLTNTHVSITIDPRTQVFGNETNSAALSSAARSATKAALVKAALEGGSALMELVMNVTISVDEASFGAVMNDISSARGGHIMSMDEGDATESSENEPAIDTSRVYAPPDAFVVSLTEDSADESTGSRQRTIVAKVPLEQMVGYLKHLKSLSGGRGTFVMSADKFERVVGQREKELKKKLRGY